MWNFFSLPSLPDQWEEMTRVEELEEACQQSFHRPVVLFKHSTSCSRSAFALDRLAKDYPFKKVELGFYYLDLLAHRDISNAIEDRFGVRHQSPQVIVLRDGKASFDTSHESISLQAIQNHL